MQGFVRMDELVGGMCGLRGFGETGEDEFQFVFIGGDVTDGEDAGSGGFAGGWGDADMVLCEIEAPFGDGAEFHGQAEEGEQNIGFEGAFFV